MDPNTERQMQRARLETQLEKLTLAQQWLSECTKKDDGDDLTNDCGQLVDTFSS
jgi:hypothetical protein